MGRVSRALAGLVLALALTAAGCGSTASTQAGPPSGSAGYPMTITQPDGSKATVPRPPTRIVTVDNPQQTMDDVVALGVRPVGALLYPAGTPGFDAHGGPAELTAQAGGVASVGRAPNKPDLERIVALHPDLIVGVDGAKIADLKQLEAIAPVISATPPAASATGIDALGWVPQVRELGRVLGRQAQAAALIARFEAAAAPVRTALSGKSVDLVLPSATGATFTLIGARFQPAGRLLAYLGLTLPTEFPNGAKTIGGDHATVSRERVGVLDAQYLMVARVLSAKDTVQTAFLADPLVKALPSVRAGRVVVTGGDEAVGGGYLTAGPLGQLAALAGIQQAFAR